MDKPKAPPLASLRAKHRCKLFSSDINQKTYVYRPLTTREFDLLVDGAITDADAEDEIVRTALVWPEDVNIDIMKAGHITALADSILSVSGFSNAEVLFSLLGNAREEAVGDVRLDMKAFIMATLPNMSIEYLDGMDIYNLASVVVLAEKVATLQQQIAGIHTETPVMFYIAPKGEEPPELQQQQQQPRQQRPAPRSPQFTPEVPESLRREQDSNVDRAALLNRLKAGDAEAAGMDKMVGLSYEQGLDKFSDEALVSMTGQTRRDDPIQKKLAQNDENVQRRLREFFQPRR